MTTSSAEQLARLAQQSLLYEAVLSPKPGLVDAFDSGAHQDMNIYTFINSATALYTGFKSYAQAGEKHQDTLPELFHHIRPIGLRLEQEMNAATQHVNTHKGAIFSFGVILAAAGFYLNKQQLTLVSPLQADQTQEIFSIGKRMVHSTLEADFVGLDHKSTLTNGERLFLAYGIKGIRGEALAGYPLIQELVLPYLRAFHSSPLKTEDKLLHALLMLIAQSEDTNLINRGGIEGLDWAKAAAADYLKNHAVETAEGKKQLQQLNQAFIKRRLSPGGSADLLALSIFIGKLEGIL